MSAECPARRTGMPNDCTCTDLHIPPSQGNMSLDVAAIRQLAEREGVYDGNRLALNLCDEVERLRNIERNFAVYRELKAGLPNQTEWQTFCDWADETKADLAAARATLSRVEALTDEWDSNPDSECTLGWAADRLNATLSSPAVSTRSEGVRINLPLSTVLSGWRDGDEHGWQTEFDWLSTHHAERLDMLTTSIQEDGIREPILLGNDGRVWDGHHRLCAADRLALETVPVTFSALSAPVLGSEGVDVEAVSEAVAEIMVEADECIASDFEDAATAVERIHWLSLRAHAALAAPVPDDEPFYFDSVTGEPCPRKGNVLCTRPYDPDHRHRAAPVPDVAAINVVFDAPPGPESGRFVEVEDDNGHARRVGQWTEREDGLWSLRIALPDVAAERVAAIKAEALREARAFVGSASRPNRAEIDRWLSRQIKDTHRSAPPPSSRTALTTKGTKHGCTAEAGVGEPR